MSTEQNKVVIKRFVDEVNANGLQAPAEQFLASTYILAVLWSVWLSIVLWRGSTAGVQLSPAAA